VSPETAQVAVKGAAGPTDRATARAQIAERGLTAVAAERVVRVALNRLPPPLVARATSHLRRLFSVGSWSAEDDAALAAAIGPGQDWYDEELDSDLALAFGWRGGSFRVDVRYTPPDSGFDAGSDSGAPGAPTRERTLGDTFDETVVLEAGRTPTEMRFGIGPSSGPAATFTHDNASRDPRVAALFGQCADLGQVTIGAGTLTATIEDETRWPEILLPLFDAITAGFGPARVAPPDRQLERAQQELGALSPDSPRDLARIIDATTSPDASFRRVAIERLDGAETIVGRAPWRRGLDDSSRAVRRSTARVLASTARADTRDLLEQALGDGDACVRYYAIRGLARIGPAASLPAVDAHRRDTDVRVRLAAEAAADGRVPA
jgi:HEAT repeats